MTHVMVDIETLGTGNGAAIISIGAVSFSKAGTGNEFYKVATLHSSMASGGKVDASTLSWWLKQPPAASAVFHESGEPITDCLKHFKLWLNMQGDKKDLHIWANAPSFDCVILVSAFKRADMKVPWHFWNERDHRTLKNLWDVKYKPSGIQHNALDDARSQACHAIKICSMADIDL